MKLTKKQTTNSAIHVLLWVAVFLFPFLFKPQDVTFSTIQLVGIYLNLFFTFLIFYLSYSLIIPLLFFRKRIVLTVAIMVFASLAGSFTLNKTRMVIHDTYIQKNSNHPRFGNKNRRMAPRRPFFEPQRDFFDTFFFYLLVSGAALSIRATQKWIREEHDRKTLEADKASLELAWLKNQVSPHFFFNTLNNIYSLIESNPEFAQKAVHMLSKLMRYLLYESNAKAIPLSKEVVFIENYIGLMKLKLTDDVNIDFECPSVPEDVKVPPLLFNPIIENAFKFGISYEQASFIHIKLSLYEEHIQLTVNNSIAQEVTQQEHSGIGLKNLKHRLDLLYKTDYQLSVNQTADTFTVELNVPFYES